VRFERDEARVRAIEGLPAEASESAVELLRQLTRQLDDRTSALRSVATRLRRGGGSVAGDPGWATENPRRR
jgi:hypothetical protein